MVARLVRIRGRNYLDRRRFLRFLAIVTESHARVAFMVGGCNEPRIKAL